VWYYTGKTVVINDRRRASDSVWPPILAVYRAPND
jgi:hypothetical protein